MRDLTTKATDMEMILCIATPLAMSTATKTSLDSIEDGEAAPAAVQTIAIADEVGPGTIGVWQKPGQQLVQPELQPTIWGASSSPVLNVSRPQCE